MRSVARAVPTSLRHASVELIQPDMTSPFLILFKLFGEGIVVAVFMRW